MRTIATMFSGGEGVGIGAKNAGLTHLWGIEIVDKIAQVARNNDFNTITGDIFDIEPETLQKPDVLHASPECQRASVANSKRGETELDRLLGKRIEHYIEALQPKIFTLENVRPYRHFQAFKSIVNKLFNLGYMVGFQNLCSADFGVPQTRRRLILRASRIGLLPILPPKEKWIGWYEAIEDLIPTLPESNFSNWQIKRLPQKAITHFVFNVDNSKRWEYKKDPERELIQYKPNEPISTLNTGNNLRLYLLGCRSKGAKWSNDIKQDNEPSQTINTHTSQLKALLSQGRVVAMTPRALARFQSFPDWYVLSGKKTLDCKIIGNAVPPLLYEKLIRQFKDFL